MCCTRFHVVIVLEHGGETFDEADACSLRWGRLRLKGPTRLLSDLLGLFGRVFLDTRYENKPKQTFSKCYSLSLPGFTTGTCIQSLVLLLGCHEVCSNVWRRVRTGIWTWLIYVYTCTGVDEFPLVTDNPTVGESWHFQNHILKCSFLGMCLCQFTVCNRDNNKKGLELPVDILLIWLWNCRFISSTLRSRLCLFYVS